MVARKRPNVTLYVYCLSCYNHCDVLCNVPYDNGYLRCIQEFCSGMLKENNKLEDLGVKGNMWKCLLKKYDRVGRTRFIQVRTVASGGHL
jgi:hypothetical protein